MSLQESQEYKVNINIHKHHHLEGAELDGEIMGECKNDAINRVNGWNDGPKGKLYDFVDVHLVNNENVHTDTKKSDLTGITNWEYTSLATYTVMYND